MGETFVLSLRLYRMPVLTDDYGLFRFLICLHLRNAIGSVNSLKHLPARNSYFRNLNVRLHPN